MRNVLIACECMHYLTLVVWLTIVLVIVILSSSIYRTLSIKLSTRHELVWIHLSRRVSWNNSAVEIAFSEKEERESPPRWILRIIALSVDFNYFITHQLSSDSIIYHHFCTTKVAGLYIDWVVKKGRGHKGQSVQSTHHCIPFCNSQKAYAYLNTQE